MGMDQGDEFLGNGPGNNGGSGSAPDNVHQIAVSRGNEKSLSQLMSEHSTEAHQTQQGLTRNQKIGIGVGAAAAAGGVGTLLWWKHQEIGHAFTNGGEFLKDAFVTTGHSIKNAGIGFVDMMKTDMGAGVLVGYLLVAAAGLLVVAAAVAAYKAKHSTSPDALPTKPRGCG